MYRFGSSVTGAARLDSDIDIAFLADGPLDPRARFAWQETLAIALGRSVDLVDLRSASTVMASQVVTTGVVIHDGAPHVRLRAPGAGGEARGILIRSHMKRMVGFRNVAVHDYQRLNLDIVRSIVRERLDDFIEFARVVLRG